MSTNGIVATPVESVAFDVDAFKANLANCTTEQKRLALYWLLHDMLGDQPDREVGVFDPDEFLYIWLVPGGIREALRYLEHPELLEELERASKEPGIPLEEARRQIYKELGITEKDLENTADDFEFTE